MILASLVAALVKPSARLADERPAISLASMVPRQFGDWTEVPQNVAQVVNPQTQELLDHLYSEVLARVYVNPAGYHVMLSVAYGGNQRGTLQAHKPEVCYPAQGFVVQSNEAGLVSTRYGDIPVRRLYATMGSRQEPLTYWFTIGDEAVRGRMQTRLVELRLGLTGRIPDGLLFRVSSIDEDQGRAYAIQQQFIGQLLHAVPQPGRKRLSGLGAT